MVGVRPNPAEHVKLARWVVDRYVRRRPWIAHLYDDLVSAGTAGLCEAVRDYDPSRGAWSSLAVVAVENAIRNEVRRISGPVRTPGGRRTALSVSIDEEHGVEADPEMARRLAHELRGTQRAEGANRPRTLLDVLASDDRTPEQDVAAAESTRLLDTCNDRERYVLEHRFAGETLAEIGEHFGLSRERVRQIEARTLRRLWRRHVRDL